MVTVQRFAFAAFVFLKLGGVAGAYPEMLGVPRCPAGGAGRRRSWSIVGPWRRRPVGGRRAMRPCACVLEAPAALSDSVRGVRHAILSEPAWASYVCVCRMEHNQ